MLPSVSETGWTHADIKWVSGKFPARDGLLQRASKRLVDEEGILPELGPTRLDRDLKKYIWEDKNHLSLKDLREYLDRYIYLPRLKDRSVLIRTVTTAIGGLVPGPFAYAESWDEENSVYRSLAVKQAANINVIIDNESLIIRADVAEAHLAKQEEPTGEIEGESPTNDSQTKNGNDDSTSEDDQTETQPTRFFGSVTISSERPARDMHRIVEAIVEQLTHLPRSDVTLRLEIDADVPEGLDSAKVRTLIENANTLGFDEKTIK